MIFQVAAVTVSDLGKNNFFLSFTFHGFTLVVNSNSFVITYSTSSMYLLMHCVIFDAEAKSIS